MPVLLIFVPTCPTFGINVKFFKTNGLKSNRRILRNNLQQKNDVQVALNKICPPWCETNPDWIPKCKSNSFLDQPFDPAEFNSVLENKKNTAASGLDGIDYEVINSLPFDYKLILLDIFNEIYRTNSYPKSWQESYIHFINKPENKGVRPIALTSHLGKLFESLIKNRLQWYCEDQNIMPNNQSGFRKGRSCNDNLADLMLQADQALTKKKDLLAVFLDVRGAFDNVNCDILLQKLSSIGCSITLVKYVKFLTHSRRLFTASLGNDYRYCFKGVPQGGVLSPLLYIIYVKDIAIGIPKSVTVSQLADDICCYCKFSPLRKCKNVIEKAAEILRKNLYYFGLDIAPDKTILIHFNNKNIPPGETHLKIGEHTIKSSETVKFLGITFDYKLSFASHINTLKQSVLKK